jgi:signal transduction histidine kinase
MALGVVQIPVPDDEEGRLAALHRYAILDTPPEPAFDNIVALLRDLLNAPITTISLVECERQWFKARSGGEGTETPRSIAFCAHTIMGADIMEIGDAALDPRFAGNPMVTGPMGVRFYAGAPLVTSDGHALGALCAYDFHPRSLTEGERRHLKSLASMVVDEMELRRVGRQLAASLRDAERVNRLKTHFVAAITHDLRSPLHTIMGFAELMQMDRSASEGCRGKADAILTVGGQMLSLVNGLLDMAALESGRMSLELAATDLGPLVAGAMFLVEERARKGGIRLSRSVAADLPVISADGRRLTQVLGNLLDNAIKFTPSGGTVAVETFVSPEAAVEVVVRDSGGGIAPEDIAKVLEPYGQTAEGLARNGTGLGLPLAKAIVEAHGGTFHLDSLPGQGTIVRMIFRAAEV